jgi:CheY-like chemotaxis protein
MPRMGWMRKRPVVLIAEDDAATRAALADLLEGHGFEVLSESDGRHALDLLCALADCEGTLPAVIILDLNMPIVDGSTFMAVFAGLRPKLADIPVVAVSAERNPHRAPPGVRAFLPKPLDVTTFLATVCNAVGIASTASLLN